MNRLQAVVLVVGTGIAWIGYSLGFQALGIPQMIEAGAAGRTSQAQVQTSDQPTTRYQVLATPTATPRAAATATVAPTQRPASTPTPTATARPTSTATAYPVREYPEQLPDGSIRHVRQWSDGRYEEVARVAAPTPQQSMATPQPRPISVTPGNVWWGLNRFPWDPVARTYKAVLDISQGEIGVLNGGPTTLENGPFLPLYFSASGQPEDIGRELRVNISHIAVTTGMRRIDVQPRLYQNLTGQKIQAKAGFQLMGGDGYRADAAVTDAREMGPGRISWTVREGSYFIFVGQSGLDKRAKAVAVYLQLSLTEE